MRASATCSAGSTRRPPDRPDVAARFATDALFHAIRLDPYLDRDRPRAPRSGRPASPRSPNAPPTTKRVLVHGDFSPKNLLIGPDGPVILDAECAWYGDPAFDLAFVLNHLLLKGAWQPQWRERYLDLFAALVDGISCPRHVGALAESSSNARPRCCRRCCSRASTASRRSST